MDSASKLEDLPVQVEPVSCEIECPSYGTIKLVLESEPLLYACEDCDFILHIIPKKGK